MRKRTKKTPNQKIKAEFRKSAQWRELRKHLIESQGGLDPITGCKLLKGCHCHHRDLSPENYTNIDEGRQVVLNSETHKMVHWCLRYIKKYHNLEVMERLLKEVTFEAKLNSFIDDDEEIIW